MWSQITVFYFNEFQYEKELQECLERIPFEYTTKKSDTAIGYEGNSLMKKILETNVKVFFPEYHQDKKELIKKYMKPYFTTDDL